MYRVLSTLLNYTTPCSPYCCRPQAQDAMCTTRGCSPPDHPHPGLVHRPVNNPLGGERTRQIPLSPGRETAVWVETEPLQDRQRFCQEQPHKVTLERIDLSRVIILEQQEQRTRRFACGASAKDAKDGASTNARLRGGRARCHRHFHDHQIIILSIIVLIISIILIIVIIIIAITTGGGARAQGEGRAWSWRSS